MDYWFIVYKNERKTKYTLTSSGAYFFKCDYVGNEFVFSDILEISEREKYSLSKRFGGGALGLYPYFKDLDEILKFTKEVLRRCEAKGAKVESNFYNSKKFYIDI